MSIATRCDAALRQASRLVESAVDRRKLAELNHGSGVGARQTFDEPDFLLRSRAFDVGSPLCCLFVSKGIGPHPQETGYHRVRRGMMIFSCQRISLQ
jgi:hypothetical protein